MRRHLTQFALVLVLPLIVLVGFFFWQLVLKERGLVETQAIDTTQALAMVVDREIYSLQNAAKILSYSIALKTSQLDVFQHSIHDMARELNIHITLYDPQAKVIVTSEPALMQDLPLLKKSELEEVSHITGLEQAHITAPYYYTAVKPVAVDGKVRYYLGLSMEVRRIADLLNLSGISDNWIVAVIDQNNRILTCNKDYDAYVGRSAPDTLRKNTISMQGRWEGETLDGTEVLSFYTRSMLSDWRIVVGIKRTEFNQPLWNAFGYFVFLVLGILLLSAFLAGFWGRKISAPVRRLAAQAQASGGSQPVAPLYSGISELDAGHVGVWEFYPATKALKLDGRSSQMLAFDGKLRADFTNDFLPSIHAERSDGAFTTMMVSRLYLGLSSM